MKLLTKIKFGSITNLSDARFAAAAGMDYLGFCFDTANPNYVPPARAKEMINWITGSQIVAEFGNQSFDEINTICEILNIDMIEVNNLMLPDELKNLHKPIIKKTDLDNFDKTGLLKELEAYKNVADIFHLFSSTANFDAIQVAEYCKQYKVIWGLPVNASTALAVINTFKPFAINISGGMEEKTGIKDFDELNELIEVMHVVDHAAI